MRDLNADDDVQLTGVGYAGEVHEGPDGNLYEWVEGVDAWGGEIGYWQGLPQVDEPALGGLGALYQASDGSLYQMSGLSEEEEAEAQADPDPEEGDAEESPAAPKMGPGRPGEIRVGPDGKKYRWVRGVGAGGKKTAFWRRLRARPRRRRPPQRPRPAPGMQARRPPPGARRGAPAGRPSGRKRKGGFLRRILPIAKVASSLIPGVGPAVAAGLTVATPLLKKIGAKRRGLGALYEAPDGSLYAVHGFAEDELDGLYEYDGVAGYLAADEPEGVAAADEQIEGTVDYDVQGADDDEGSYVGDADDLEGYVREEQIGGGIDAYVPEAPRQTRMSQPSPPPDVWKPIW